MKRITCQVPGCPNSSARFADHYGYLCSRHWRCVPTWMKRRRSRLMRALCKTRDAESRDKSWVALTHRGQRAMCRAWDTMVRSSIRAASGL